jgi:hypothetical protein
MQLLNSSTPLIGASPYQLGEFQVGLQPVLVTAFGLGTDDLICIETVEKVQVGNAHVTADDCGIQLPADLSTKTVVDLMECGKKICLCNKQPWAIIGLSGSYQLKVSGTNINNKAVTVNAEPYLGTPHALFTYCSTCGNP